jgi:hypothetical protein
MNNLRDNLDRLELDTICQGLKNNGYIRALVDDIVDFDLIAGSYGGEWAKYSLLDKHGDRTIVLFSRNSKGYPIAEESHQWPADTQQGYHHLTPTKD